VCSCLGDDLVSEGLSGLLPATHKGMNHQRNGHYGAYLGRGSPVPHHLPRSGQSSSCGDCYRLLR